jgi:hypothetical protein
MHPAIAVVEVMDTMYVLEILVQPLLTIMACLIIILQASIQELTVEQMA